ncbi:GntR family transcriptional regulator [Nocardiopsis sp. NPDC006198]|uniref:GntR family transcriptional regulator n=1 Tax=Nocardiopsis sp. NPDC006198 TaxID=3154472 RepID=UPI0033AC820C
MDESTARPMQGRIADDLREQIRSGDLAPGARLPTLAVLATRYAVSVIVARRAVELLRQEGLVISRRGSGSYVRQAPPVHRYNIDRYSRKIWSGGEPQPILLAEAVGQGQDAEQGMSTDRIPAPDFVAQRLPDVEPGDPVHVRRRTTTLDGVLHHSADSYFALATGDRAPAIVDGAGPGGHIARINALSPVLSVQTELTTRMPSGQEAERLQIPPGTPVFSVIRTYHCEDGPLDVTHVVIRGDMAAFDHTFPVPD